MFRYFSPRTSRQVSTFRPRMEALDARWCPTVVTGMPTDQVPATYVRVGDPTGVGDPFAERGAVDDLPPGEAVYVGDPIPWRGR